MPLRAAAGPGTTLPSAACYARVTLLAARPISAAEVPAVFGLPVLDRLQPEAAGTSLWLGDLERGQPRLVTQIPVRHGVPLLMDAAHQGR
jgi:hypothetical protein